MLGNTKGRPKQVFCEVRLRRSSRRGYCYCFSCDGVRDSPFPHSLYRSPMSEKSGSKNKKAPSDLIRRGFFFVFSDCLFSLFCHSVFAGQFQNFILSLCLSLSFRTLFCHSVCHALLTSCFSDPFFSHDDPCLPAGIVIPVSVHRPDPFLRLSLRDRRRR